MDVPFQNNIRLDKFLSDAQRECVERFGCWLRDKHFHRQRVRSYVRAAKLVLCWANCSGIGIEDLNSKGLARYASALKARGKLRYRDGDYTVAFRGARHFAAFLSEAGMVRESAAVIEGPTLLKEFNNWMRSHRGVTERTLDRYRPVIECLLRALGEDAECYNAKKLRDFVLNLAKRYTTTSKITTAVRMFLRFLIATKRCRVGLEACIPTVPATRRLPNYLSVEAVERIIAACDDTTQRGARDRAIVLLLARLGLRASEVAGLKFRDVDWEQGTITVLGKNRREARLPLPSDVGNALLRYITRWRPEINNEVIFLTRRAPIVAIANHVVCKTARRAMERAGVDSPSHGAHIFRHSAATGMLRAGASLQEIGLILRHASLQATERYAQVDTDLLSLVVRPWPGVEAC
jgi:integrase/recombinase XerD